MMLRMIMLIVSAAPVIARVKTANPATAGERRNVLNAAKVALSFLALLAHGVNQNRTLCKRHFRGPRSILPISVDAKEGENVLFC